jgi:hypothetical protein
VAIGAAQGMRHQEEDSGTEGVPELAQKEETHHERIKHLFL